MAYIKIVELFPELPLDAIECGVSLPLPVAWFTARLTAWLGVILPLAGLGLGGS